MCSYTNQVLYIAGKNEGEEVWLFVIIMNFFDFLNLLLIVHSIKQNFTLNLKKLQQKVFLFYSIAFDPQKSQTKSNSWKSQNKHFKIPMIMNIAMGRLSSTNG